MAEMIDWQAMPSFDDDRGCRCVSLRLGHMKATGFYSEAEISLTDAQIGQLIDELKAARLKL